MKRTKGAGVHRPKIEVISTAIQALRCNPHNVRTHSKKQTRLLAASIQEFGFFNPVVTDEDGVILAGHGRLEAAKLAGLTHVPVVRAEQLTPEQKRAFLLADNKIAEHAGWDRDRLALELEALTDLLPAVGLDVSITGFETPEIDLLLADMSGPESCEPDEVPTPPAEAVTQPGDQWTLGKHRLLCGDSRDPINLKTLMQDELASACFCDPPYNVRIKSVVGRGKRKHAEFAFASGEMTAAQFRDFLNTTLSNAAAVSRAGAVHFVCIDWRHFGDLRDACNDVYDEMLNLIVWVKTNAGQGSFYRSQHELIAVFRVGGGGHRNNVELGRFGRNRSNVWRYPGSNAFGSDRAQNLASHPTIKPVALITDAILDCTARGDVVLDHFAGSGSTILAAEKVGRKARAIEFDPRYVDLAVSRWQLQTKSEAVLDSDGRTFDEVKLDRAARSAADDHQLTEKIVRKPSTRPDRPRGRDRCR